VLWRERSEWWLASLVFGWQDDSLGAVSASHRSGFKFAPIGDAL